MQQASGTKWNGSLWPLSGRVQVLDEEHLVSQVVIDEFVDRAGREEEAVTTSAYAMLIALHDVGGGIGRGVDKGCVSDRILAESGAGVAHPKGHGAGGADRVHLDNLIGVEGGAVLHCVDEDLAQGHHYLLACGLGQLRGELFGEGHKTVGSGEAAVDSDGDPAGAC